MRKPSIVLCTIATALNGCATTPPMTVHYYLPRADLTVTVKKTVSCDSNATIFTVLSATHDVTYSASSPATDKNAVQQIQLGQLDGLLSDADLAFSFTNDGRLLGLNVATTGEAGEIVKSALSIAQPITGLISPAMAGPESRLEEIEAACSKIAMWGGQDKALTLTYAATIPFGSPSGGVAMMIPDASSEKYAEELGGVIGAVCWKVGKSVPREPMGLDPSGAPRGDIGLVLRQPAVAHVEIDNWDQGTCGEPRGYETDLGAPHKTTVWSGEVDVPQHGNLYVVLIPKAAAFGKQNFTLALSDEGTVTQLTYGKTNGVAQALGAGSSIEASAIATPAQRTQRATDEANAIAAQEKLAACQADHAKCGN